MQNEKTTTFDDLVQLASDFVIQHGGVWDHADWLEFLSRVEQRDIVLTEQVQTYLGELVEAIKRFHNSILSVEGTMLALNKLVRDSASFISRQRGVWGPAEWATYCRNVTSSTIYLSEEMRSYLGGILESMRSCYGIAPRESNIAGGRTGADSDKD